VSQCTLTAHHVWPYADDLPLFCHPCTSDAHCDGSGAHPQRTPKHRNPSSSITLIPASLSQRDSGGLLLWSGSARLHDLSQFTSPADESLLWGNFSQQDAGPVGRGPAIAMCLQQDGAGEGICVPTEVTYTLAISPWGSLSTVFDPQPTFFLLRACDIESNVLCRAHVYYGRLMCKWQQAGLTPRRLNFLSA
jgi:hypothetical protein